VMLCLSIKNSSAVSQGNFLPREMAELLMFK